MDSYMLPFVLRDSLLCLLFLAGIVVGIIAIVRNQKKVGIPVIVGFLLLGIDPIAEFVLFNIISPTLTDTDSFTTLNWTYVCIGSLFNTIGVLAILAAIYFAIQPKPVEMSAPDETVIHAPNQ